MKKHLFWLAALALGMAACTTDPNGPEGPKGPEDDNTTPVASAQLIELKADQSRLLTPGASLAATSAADAENNGAWLEGPKYLQSVEGGESKDVSHKYSATGLAFNGNTLYISWHSNRKADLDEDSEDHQHGTNVDGDSEPSLDSADDWGGIVDVITIDPSDITKLECTKLYLQPEHKYNHVLYADNNLYLASTSWFVGAALHVIPTTATGLTTSEAERFSLTGNSANCAVKVGDEIVTISGRTEGGLNWFNPATADTDQSKASVNATTANFGGKHIYVDGNKVYTLRNPQAPVIEVYDAESKSIETFATVSGNEDDTDFGLLPIDGKNVLAGDENYIYACCGQYGLHIYDKATGEKVASSHKNIAENKNAKPWQKYYTANGVDVDDNYVYVANGAGLVILEKNFDNLNQYGGLKLKKYAQFTGTVDFTFNNRSGNDNTEEGQLKESSNFVKLYTNGDKHYAFVAYGMYGLRIYDLSELYPAVEE
ncbi:MAG: hypothetical protein J1D86_03035 [Alistipes sp.]|nr:hypothetical protein [Alistipes sp.]